MVSWLEAHAGRYLDGIGRPQVIIIGVAKGELAVGDRARPCMGVSLLGGPLFSHKIPRSRVRLLARSFPALVSIGSKQIRRHRGPVQQIRITRLEHCTVPLPDVILTLPRGRREKQVRGDSGAPHSSQHLRKATSRPQTHPLSHPAHASSPLVTL